MAPLHIVRPIAASAREVVEHVRASFAEGRGEVSLVDVSGPTFALVLRPGSSTRHTVWTSIFARDTAEGCVLVGHYRGRRGVSIAWIALGIAWLGALLIGAPPLPTTGVALVLLAALLIRRSSRHGDVEAFAVMCAALDGVLMPLPLASPYRAALAPPSTPEERALVPNVQSQARAGEVTKVWVLPPRAPVVAPPVVLAIPRPSVIVDMSRIPPLVRTGDPLRGCIDVAAEPAAVHARLCAVFPENAARMENATSTGFVFIGTSGDPRDVVASVNVEIAPLGDGTRIEVRWSRFRMQHLSGWLGYVGVCFFLLVNMELKPLFFAVVPLSLAILVWFVHFRRGPRAVAAFDSLAWELQVALMSLSPGNDPVQGGPGGA